MNIDVLYHSCGEQLINMVIIYTIVSSGVCETFKFSDSFVCISSSSRIKKDDAVIYYNRFIHGNKQNKTMVNKNMVCCYRPQ